MNPEPSTRRAAALGAFSKSVSAAVVLIGCLVLVGWLLRIGALTSILPGWVSIKPNTALAFVLAGVALWFVRGRAANPRARRVAQVCAVAVALVGLLTLGEYLFGWTLSLDQLLFTEPTGTPGTSHPGRMAPNTALNFLLVGGALLALDAKPPRIRRVAEAVALATCVVALLALTGYAYGVESLYGLSRSTRMAPPTAVTFLLLGAGVLASRDDGWVISLALNEGAGGLIMRRLLPAAIVILLALGWLRLQGQRAGLYDTEFGVSLTAVSSILLLAALIFWSAAALKRTEAERSRAALALRESEHRLFQILEALPVGVFVVDAAGKAYSANQAAQEILGKGLVGGVDAGDLPAVYQAYRAGTDQVYPSAEQPIVKALAGQQARATDIEIRRPDRTVPIEVWASPVLDVAARVTHAVAAFTDITERKRAEEELRASEASIRAIVNTAVDGIMTIQERGIVESYNPACERLFGYRADEVIGENVTMLMPSPYHEEHDGYLARYRRTGERKIIGIGREVLGRRKDGSVFPIYLAVGEVRVGDRRTFTGIVHDLTENKRAEAQIHQRTAELEAANRELEAFSYSVSHDLRAPLRAMDGFSRMLVEDHGAALGAEAQRLLGVIRANTQRMGQLIDDLLTFSRFSRRSLTAEPVDMAAVVETVVGELRPDAPVTADIVVDALPPARGDPALLRQVWANLIGNALKFTRTRPRPQVAIGSLQREGETIFFVRDNGVGFDMEYAGKLFGVFQRLHRGDEFEGTGVGLAIVQRIVHRHGGRVWAEAKPEAGATFFFTLPATE